MLELFGLIAGAFVLIPILIAAGLVIAVLCGVGQIFGFVWELFWSVFGVGFALLFFIGVAAFMGFAIVAAILF